jgi:hypothetical protein
MIYEGPGRDFTRADLFLLLQILERSTAPPDQETDVLKLHKKIEARLYQA